MKRRRFLTAAALPLVASAGCASSNGSDSTTPETDGETTRETTTIRLSNIPGWDDDSLNASELLDAHVAALRRAGSFTTVVSAAGTGDGDVRMRMALNTTQGRELATLTQTKHPDRVGYLTDDRSVIRIAGDPPQYQTTEDPQQSIESQVEYAGAYQNDDWGVSLADELDYFSFDVNGTTTVDGARVARFESTGESSKSDETATLFVAPSGVIRKFEATADSGSVTYVFRSIGQTTVTPPDWLSKADETPGTTADEGVTVHDGDVVVDVTAYQWGWRFEYPDRDVIVNKEFVVPVDRPVVVRATTIDVEHALTMPAYDTTVDAAPDETNAVRFTPTETGDVAFHCSVDCGKGHEYHTGTMRVVTESAFEDWLDSNER